MKALYAWVQNSGVQQPIKLGLKLEKVVYDRNRQGNDARYFSVYVGVANITQMVAEAVNLKLSKAKDTRGCLIIHGSGMDMGFALQSRVYKYACQDGFPNMFDCGNYKLI